MPTLEPQIDRLIRMAIESRLLDVHTCTLGKVQTVHGTPPTSADVILPVKRPVLAEDDSTRFEDLPVLPQVPIMWPAGDGTSYPGALAAGDTVMVFFTEDNTAEHWDTGSISEPGDLTRHGMSSAFCWPFTRTATPAVDFAALASKVDAALLSLQTWSATVATPLSVAPWAGVGSVSATVTRAK